MLKRNMSNITKLDPTPSVFTDNSSTMTLNALSFRRIMHRRPPPTTPRTEQSYIIVNTFDNNHTNDSLRRTILIDSAARQRGFLPYDYRIANTFESIRRQRTPIKPLPKLSTTNPRISSRTPTHSDVFGNSTSSMSKLAEQRLILREKSVLKQHNTSPVIDKHEKSLLAMSDADFATDIPNALDLLLKITKRKSTMEQFLSETLKRERLQQARYRLLPLNRAPHN